MLIIVFGALAGTPTVWSAEREAMRTAPEVERRRAAPVFQFGASHEEEMEEQGEGTPVHDGAGLLWSCWTRTAVPPRLPGGNNVEVSDQVVAQAAAAATEESGAISGLNLRHLQDTDREGNSRSPLPIWAGRPTHCGR